MKDKQQSNERATSSLPLISRPAPATASISFTIILYTKNYGVLGELYEATSINHVAGP